MARALRAIRSRACSQIRRALLATAAGVALSAVGAVARAEPEAAPPPDDFYLNEAGEVVPFSATYDSWFGPGRYERDYVRAGVEHAGVVVLEMFFYWYDPDANSVDWQFPDVKTKLTSNNAVRFDDNLMRTNYIYHPLAGAAHYLATRVNGFGVPESFASAAAFSTLYEAVLEWRELVSINDLIVTPLGGMAAGELLNQLGDYLNSEPPAVRTKVRRPAGPIVRDGAQVILGFPRRIHDSLDDPAYPVVLERDNLGLSSAYAHEFRLWTGLQTAGNEQGRTHEFTALGGQIELFAMPGFLRPGRFERWYGSGNFTRAELRSAFAGSRFEIELDVDSHLFGHYSQNIDLAGSTGVANELGFGTGLYYLDRHLFGRRDQLGIVHVLRPIERAFILADPVRLELELDVSPDFAALHSAAYEEYARASGTDGTKSPLVRHGYWHGWGLSAGASAALLLGGTELAVRARYGRYESIEGVDREQDTVTKDLHGSETVIDLGATLTVEPDGAPVFARFEIADTLRRSFLEPDIEVDRSDRRMVVALGLVF